MAAIEARSACDSSKDRTTPIRAPWLLPTIGCGRGVAAKRHDGSNSGDLREPASRRRHKPLGCSMIELFAVTIRCSCSFADALLKEAGIDHAIVDQNMSVMEGSLGILPRRMLVTDEHHESARRILVEAGLEHELSCISTPKRARCRADLRRLSRAASSCCVQQRKGHRAGLDAALLQALVPAEAEGAPSISAQALAALPSAVAARATNLSTHRHRMRSRSRRMRPRGIGRFRRIPASRPRVQLVEADVTANATRNLLGGRGARLGIDKSAFDPEGRGSHSADRLPTYRACSARRNAEAWCATRGRPPDARRHARPDPSSRCTLRSPRCCRGKFGGDGNPARSSDRIRGGNPHPRHGSPREPRPACPSARPCPAPAGGRLDAARGRDPSRSGGTLDVFVHH